MTQVPQTIESPPRGIRIAATAAAIATMLAGMFALFSISMPWVEESYVFSHGPLLNVVVFVLALVAGTLMSSHGPRVRSTEKLATRQRVDAFRGQGYSLREATRLGRPMYTLRQRAGRLFGGGVLAVTLGVIELAVVSYNLHEIDRLGVTPSTGPALATFVAWTLIAGGIAAFVIGVVAISATPEVLSIAGTAYATPAPAAWTPTHHVPAEALPAYQAPMPGTPVAMLDPDLPVMVLEHRGDWAHVRAVNGWEGWVDGRRLVSEAPAAAPTLPPMPVG
ncbi:MAG: SH3 domain-containing protein [Actinomycetota bacterium]